MKMMTDNEDTASQIGASDADPQYHAESLAIAVAAEVARMMEDKKTSLEQVAERIGVSKSDVSRLLENPASVTLLMLAKLGRALGVEPVVILEGGHKLTGQPRHIDGLYFAPNCGPWRTPLRDAALGFIYRTAAELADGLLVSADVEVFDTPGEPDSEILDLTLTVDAVQEYADKLGNELGVKWWEWSQDLPEHERMDQGRRISFMVVSGKS